MRILIITAGTKGDVAPAAALAKVCREQGAEAAAVCTHTSFKSDIVASGATFFDLGVALDDALRDTPEGQELAAAGAFSKKGAAQRFMDPIFTKWMDSMLAALMTFRPDVIVLFTLPIYISSGPLEKATRGVSRDFEPCEDAPSNRPCARNHCVAARRAKRTLEPCVVCSHT